MSTRISHCCFVHCQYHKNNRKLSKHPDYGNKSENRKQIRRDNLCPAGCRSLTKPWVCALCSVYCVVNKIRLKYYLFIDDFRHLLRAIIITPSTVHVMKQNFVVVEYWHCNAIWKIQPNVCNFDKNSFLLLRYYYCQAYMSVQSWKAPKKYMRF